MIISMYTQPDLINTTFDIYVDAFIILLVTNFVFHMLYMFDVTTVDEIIKGYFK